MSDPRGRIQILDVAFAFASDVLDDSLEVGEDATRSRREELRAAR